MSPATIHFTWPAQTDTSVRESFSTKPPPRQLIGTNFADAVNKILQLAKEDSKAIMNVQNGVGNTPLHWASLNGHFDVVKILVSAGADVTLVNEKGYDACYYAEQNGKMEVAELLLKEGTGLDKTASGKDEDGLETDEDGAQDGAQDEAQDEEVGDANRRHGRDDSAEEQEDTVNSGGTGD